MSSRTLTYFADGKSFAGYLAFDERSNERRPGVLVLHEGGGLSDQTRRRADMLAALGYVAFAPDLYGERFKSREQAVAYISDLVGNTTSLRRRLNAAMAALKSHRAVDDESISAAGFCFGGLAALELARSGAALACAVCFHGGLHAAAPAERNAVKAKILVCTGADDPFITREQRSAFEDEMQCAGADFQVILYSGAMHGFTNSEIDPSQSPGSKYHELADRRSWQAMCALLEEVTGRMKGRNA